MKRKVYITRKDDTPKYSGKVLNIWLDSDTPNPPGYKLAAGKTISGMSVNEKEHYLVLQRPGFLGGAVQRYTIPTGSDDLELTVTVNGYGQLSVRKKPAKKSSSSSKASSGSKASGGTKVGGGSKAGGAAKKPVSTTRNLYVTRGSALGHLPNVPIRMVVDGTTSKQPLLYEFDPDMIYTITMDKKMHELVFFYPDVQTGDLVLRTLDAGSKDEAFYVDFDINGVLVAMPCELPKNLAGGNSAGGFDIASSPTTAGVKEYIANYIDPDKGAPVPVLLHALNTFEHLRVSVGSDAVSFFACHKEMDDQKIASCSYAFANQKSAGAAGTFTSLNTLSQRNQLLAAIRDFVNNECPGVSMKGTKIYKDASSAGKASTKGKKTTTPDLSESLTCIEVVADVMRNFNEKSEFAADLDKVAKTCLLSVEEDRVRVTIMVEDFETAQALPDAGTQVKEFVYSEVDLSAYFELNYLVTQKSLDNQFDILVREEDRQILMERILTNLSNMPHLIVEGNTFRSRRRGEELIDVEHTLTAAAMKHKIMKLFTPDSKLVDVLRHSNVNYCQISPDEKDISFAYIDMDSEICEIINYTFEELVGPELLEGEDCFGELRYGHEKDMLSSVIGQGLCTLPYLQPYYKTVFDSVTVDELKQSLGTSFYNTICLNTDVISKVNDVYETPAWITGSQDDPEEPEEPELPAKSSLADSPTTQGVIAQLADYFKDGGAFNLLMKTMQIERAVLNAGSEEVSVGFLKELPDGSLNVTGNFELQYKNFGAGAEGAFTELDMDQQDELEEILWSEFPFLRN